MRGFRRSRFRWLTSDLRERSPPGLHKASERRTFCAESGAIERAFADGACASRHPDDTTGVARRFPLSIPREKTGTAGLVCDGLARCVPAFNSSLGVALSEEQSEPGHAGCAR
ncbi:hypothetical protein SKAU_G00349120 [Synaphobranchus kaupii]|uniref:Uncharacterized protein n=1 Tax=Synaphobranchus kaupii TaxID=118154 RepID=A0A9Q1EJZ4_SYNKA|nr:hypothetical protein SKAU_G00349120 [Synaphobranchus kaupii]